MTWLAVFWPFIWHYGAGVAVLAGAIALAWLTPFKKTFLTLAAATALLLVGYSVGVKDGTRVIQARWDSAERATLKRGQNARDAAELAIPPLRPDDADPRPSAGRVCIDRFDRDCH